MTPEEIETEAKDLQDFNTLCDRIEKLDPNASNYLRELLAKYNFEAESWRTQPNFSTTGKLSDCVVWISTPQGHRYWENINNLLEAGES